MNQTSTPVLIDLTLTPHIATISLPQLNVSIVSHCTKYFKNDPQKIAHMLKLLAQILEESK